jgi:hypothetical protein
MQSVDLTIVAGSQVVNAFKAVKQFDPSAMLGSTLELFRSSRPLHIDLANCQDHVTCFSSLLRLLNELDELQIPYQIAISDQFQKMDGETPVWTPRPGSKTDIVASLEDERKRRLDRNTTADAELRKSYQPPEPPARLTRLKEIFHERWQRLGFDALLPEERDHVLLWELHAEVSNGTFDQYLYNTSGDHALEAVETLRRTGPKTVLDILLRVLDALPDGWCADRCERIRRLASMSDRVEVLRSLTDQYYDALETQPEDTRLIDNIESAYVRAGLISEPSVGPEPRSGLGKWMR